MKVRGEACDDLVRRIIEALDRRSSTPIDREDIIVSTSLDEILDNMEETRTGSKSPHRRRPPRRSSWPALCMTAAAHLNRPSGLAAISQAEVIQAHLLEVGRLRRGGPALPQGRTPSCLPERRRGHPDPDQWRELYAWLEETVDPAGTANVIRDRDQGKLDAPLFRSTPS